MKNGEIKYDPQTLKEMEEMGYGNPIFHRRTHNILRTITTRIREWIEQVLNKQDWDYTNVLRHTLTPDEHRSIKKELYEQAETIDEGVSDEKDETGDALVEDQDK